MPMYGFDSHNWRHQLGFFLMFFAPWGLPLIVGVAMVLLLDLSIALFRRWRLATERLFGGKLRNDGVGPT